MNKRLQSQRSGIPFELSHEEYEALYAVTACEACGKEVLHMPIAFGGGWSLDKLVPSIGYVPGNVGVLCKRCNTIKNDGGIEDLEKVLAYMRRHGLQ